MGNNISRTYNTREFDLIITIIEKLLEKDHGLLTQSYTVGVGFEYNFKYIVDNPYPITHYKNGQQWSGEKTFATNDEYGIVKKWLVDELTSNAVGRQEKCDGDIISITSAVVVINGREVLGNPVKISHSNDECCRLF